MKGNPSSQNSNLFTHCVDTWISPSAMDSQTGWTDPIPITCCWYVLSKWAVFNLIFSIYELKKKKLGPVFWVDLMIPKGIYDTYYTIFSNYITMCQRWWLFLMKKCQLHTLDLPHLSVGPLALSYQTKMAPATLKEQCLSFPHLKACVKLDVATHLCNSSTGAT